ncbi:MAG: hypothetical protein J5982_03265 [Bacilli bacterium]|nr:hypothetical protein [Bacilli bacterium]
MKRKMFVVVLLIVILLVTGCDKEGTQKNENKKKLSKEEISLSSDGYTKSIDTSNFDLKCFDNIKYHFDDNVFVSNDGTVCLVNYEKPFSLSKKNTLFIDEKLDGIVYGAIKNDNTYYFLTDKEMLKLDENYNFVAVTDLAEMNNFGFRGSEAIGGIKKTSFDKIFFSGGLFYILKDNSLYRFSYYNAYENFGENGDGYNPYLDKYKIDTGTINEEIIDYMHGNFSGDIIVTNNGYYRKTLTNSDEINKYNDVLEKYDFVKLEISNYKEKIRFISPNYIIFDNAIYRFVPVELR